MAIRLYKKTTIDYTTNGDYIIDPIECIYDSGDINEEETLKVLLQVSDNDNYDYIEIGDVIGADTDLQENQLFRIKDIDLSDSDFVLELNCVLKSIDDLGNTFTYNSSNENVLIMDTGDVNGQQALDKLFGNMQYKYDKTRAYIGHTDITTVTSRAKWERKSIEDCLISSDDNSFINRWGGELYLKDNEVYLNRRIGGDYGTEIRYGKNIESMTVNTNISSMATRIIPIGYDGIRLDGKTPWVDSKNINNWYSPITVERQYDSVKLKDNNSGVQDEGYDTIEECRAELIRLANKEFEDTNCDAPIVNIKVDMVLVRDTIEYKELGLEALEEVHKGDTVYCIHNQLGIKTKARVMKIEYDCLRHEVISVEIGDVSKSFFDRQKTVAQQLNDILGEGNTVKGDKVAGIISGLNTTFRCQRNNAQKQEILAMLFEDDLEGSENRGACCIGTKGLMIANSKTPDGRDWDWKTFITAGLVYSEWLVGNLRSVLIKSLNGESFWDLNTNELYLAEGRIHGQNFDLNMGTGEIHISGNAIMEGADLSLNFNTGYIYSKHGRFGNDDTYYDLDEQRIHGSQTDMYLATGKYYFANNNFTIEGDKVTMKNADIDNANITNGSIDNANITNGSIDNANITNGSIDNANINKGTIDSANVNKAEIDTAHIKNATIDSSNFNSSSGNIALNGAQGTAKIGNFSVGSDNKVSISDGSFIAKDGDDYCKVDSGMISWGDGSRINDKGNHTLITPSGVTNFSTLDIIGNKEGVGIISKSNIGKIFVTDNGVDIHGTSTNDRTCVSVGNKYTFVGSASSVNGYSTGKDAGSIMLDASNAMVANSVISGGLVTDYCGILDLRTKNFKSYGTKDCVQPSETYGSIDYHCVEDITYLLTYTPIDEYYETKKNNKGYYSTAIRIPLMVQETIRTDLEYNVYITPYGAEDGTPMFASYNVMSRNKEYFVIASDRPMRFKYKLECRRTGFEELDKEHTDEEFNKPKINSNAVKKLEEIQHQKDLEILIPLWEQCGQEWKEYGECYEY